MNQRFILFRRSGVFYAEDTTTGKQTSLRTKDAAEAKTLIHAKNESFRQPVLNLQIARAYLAASDPNVSTRTWQVPMDEMTKTKTGSTRERHERAMQDKAFDGIRNLPLLQTEATHFLKVIQAGTVTTNLYLRRIHNFALDMGWLPWPVLPRKRWPRICFKEKRGITPARSTRKSRCLPWTIRRSSGGRIRRRSPSRRWCRWISRPRRPAWELMPGKWPLVPWPRGAEDHVMSGIVIVEPLVQFRAVRAPFAGLPIRAPDGNSDSLFVRIT